MAKKQTAWLILTLLLITPVLAGTYCYQETANATSSCGGLATGNYAREGGVPVNRNWYFYVNYAKPFGVGALLWQVKHGNLSTYNATIPDSCFIQNSTHINLRVYGNSAFNEGSGQMDQILQLACNAGEANGGWLPIGTTVTAHDLSYQGTCTYNIPQTSRMYDTNYLTGVELDTWNNNTDCWGPGANVTTFWEEAAQWYIPGFNINFTTPTDVVINTQSCTQTNDCKTYTNVTGINLTMNTLSDGRIQVIYNKDTGGAYQQLYEFDKTHLTDLNLTLLTETVDITQQFQAEDNGLAVATARICAYKPSTDPVSNTTKYLTTECSYVNNQGKANLLLRQQTTYQICAEANGYTTTCKNFYITPANTQTQIIDITPVIGHNDYTIDTGCPPTYTNTPFNCTISVTASQRHNPFCAYKYSNGLNNFEGYSCVDLLGTNIFTLTIDNRPNYTIQLIDENNNLIQTIILKKYTTINSAPSIDVNINSTNSINGKSIQDRLNEDPQYWWVFAIIMTIIGVIVGYGTDEYFEGHGILGTGLWFGFVAVMGHGSILAVFWIPVIIIALKRGLDYIIPLMK